MLFNFLIHLVDIKAYIKDDQSAKESKSKWDISLILKDYLYWTSILDHAWSRSMHLQFLHALCLLATKYSPGPFHKGTS